MHLTSRQLGSEPDPDLGVRGPVDDKDLRGFPEEARRDAGTDLRLVQRGEEPRDWKPMPSVGKGVREIRVRTQDGAYRMFHVVEDARSIYVLHAFQKKTPKTSKADIDTGKRRYASIP